MSRTMVNFCLDALLLVLFVACVWCVAVTRFAFPPATAAAGWGWPYDAWRDLHFGLLCALVLAVLVHVMLHWNWVCGVVTTRLLARREGKKRKWTEGEQTLVGVGLLIVLINLLGFALAAAVLTARGPDQTPVVTGPVEHSIRSPDAACQPGISTKPAPRAIQIRPVNTTHQAATR